MKTIYVLAKICIFERQHVMFESEYWHQTFRRIQFWHFSEGGCLARSAPKCAPAGTRSGKRWTPWTPAAWTPLEGSFPAVSKPNFANKYAIERSWRDLYNALLCIALQSQFFVKILPNIFLNFAKFSRLIDLTECLKKVAVVFCKIIAFLIYN